MDRIYKTFAALCLGVLLLPAGATRAQCDTSPFPPFRAKYDVQVGGVKAADSEFSLTLDDRGDYLYRQDTRGRSLFGEPDKAYSTSHLRFTADGIRSLEFRAHKDGGDGDDNVHLFFDWDGMRVENRATLKPWTIDMPPGTLDTVVMQLAMLMDVKNGRDDLSYPVATRGRIKTYTFERAGEETVELEAGSYRAIKLERTDDDKDQSWIWAAPDLHYLPVRFVKKKRFGLKIDMRLREIEFLDTAPTATATPAEAPDDPS